MNKQELVDAASQKCGLTKQQTSAALNAVLDTISETMMKGESVTLIGFGTFEVRQRKEREGRNLHTGEKMTIPAANVPAFKAGKVLKDTVK